MFCFILLISPFQCHWLLNARTEPKIFSRFIKAMIISKCIIFLNEFVKYFDYAFKPFEFTTLFKYFINLSLVIEYCI